MASSGGNPGGFLEGIETNPAGGKVTYIAPSTWNGNWNSYIGGTLSYDIKIISGTSYFQDVDVYIYSGSSYISYTNSNLAYWSGWKTFSIPLTQAAFGNNPNFNSVMFSVTGLSIRGEYITGAEEEGLDNVIVKSATPIPAPFWLISSGLAGLIALKRKRTG